MAWGVVDTNKQRPPQIQAGDKQSVPECWISLIRKREQISGLKKIKKRITYYIFYGYLELKLYLFIDII